VYARALAAAQAVLVSRANGAGGAIGNGASSQPSISDNGARVAFASTASDLGDGDGDTVRDIHVRDLAASTTQLASRAEGAGGAKGDGDSETPAIAGDGSAVAFTSTSSNLGVDPGRNDEGLNNFPFLRELSGGHTIALGRGSGAAGAVSRGGYDQVAVDQHAANVVFTSMNSDLDPLADGVFSEVFQRHLAGGFETRLVSRPVDAPGRPAAVGQVENDGRAVSADGRFAVFTTQAPLAGPNNGVRQVYVRDALLGTTQLVSRTDGPQGAPADMEAAQASISADGTRVAFATAASNLPGTEGVKAQVFVRDLVAGTTTLVSTGPSGPGNSYAFQPAISGDGTKVAFASSASNLVSGDNNGFEDVFVRDLVAGTTTLASVTSTGGAMQDNAYEPLINADGTRVAFVTSAELVVPDESGSGQHLYVRDIAAGTTTQVDRKADGSPSDSSTDRISMSADGNRFMFSTNTKLTADSQSTADAYVRDVAAGTTIAVGVGPGGEHPTAQVFPYSISFDGTKVAIATHAGAFSAGDPGGGWLRNLSTGTTTHIAGPGFEAASLDADGGCVVFQSSDSGLASPSYAGQDVYLFWLHAVAGECPVHAPDTTITSGPDGTKTVREAYSVFAFRADEGGATFACSLDDRPMAPCGDSFHTGALRDSLHRFKVAATDRTGNTDPTPALVTFKVGVPPRVTNLRLDRRGRLVFKLSEKARVRVQVTRAGRAHSASVGRLTVKRSLERGTRRIKLPMTRLRSGHYHATVTATDASGNRSVPKRKSFDVRK
jgi:Tol biopolymer transport system component